MGELDELADHVENKSLLWYQQKQAAILKRRWRNRPFARWVVWFFCVCEFSERHGIL
jgi:hypothetical protein